MKVLVTGVAGFIASKIAEQLLKTNREVIGIDNLNDYYNINLKIHRLNQLREFKNFTFIKLDIENKFEVENLFLKHQFSVVYNLAARAGVRYSIENPTVYFTTNTMGSLNLLEMIKHTPETKYVLASTSSLYAGQEMPFNENLPVNTPISPYAASKKAAEALSFTYHYLFNIDISIVRYFTVFGPAGRPDMSLFIFAEKILKGEEVPILGTGKQARDFTFVDDIARGTILASKKVGFEVFNLGGGNSPISLTEVITSIEKMTQKKAKIKYLPKVDADMDVTWADISKAKRLIGWSPEVNFEKGLERHIAWHEKNFGKF